MCVCVLLGYLSVVFTAFFVGCSENNSKAIVHYQY